jgi:hypothetical protein
MENTRDDVIAAVKAAFPGGDAATLLGVLDQYGAESCEREKERVQLAIVALSGGSEDKLVYFVQVAKADYRDILHWAASGPLPDDEGEALRAAAIGLIESWKKK